MSDPFTFDWREIEARAYAELAETFKALALPGAEERALFSAEGLAALATEFEQEKDAEAIRARAAKLHEWWQLHSTQAALGKLHEIAAVAIER